MPDEKRQERLRADHEAMRALKEQSTIFDFEAKGDPPDRYEVTFRGKGLDRATFAGQVREIDVHRCELRMGYSYPSGPPELKWLTSTFHPNISSSGYLRVPDCGLDWREDMGIDAICERLWDMARFAHMDMAKANNYSAKEWIEKQREIELPVDSRPLRDTAAAPRSNVVRYERRAAPSRPSGPPPEEDILYIGEDTPTPELPRKRDDDEDVMYIGDE